MTAVEATQMTLPGFDHAKDRWVEAYDRQLPTAPVIRPG